jgi:two-component sensor histidine kinase
MPLRLLAEVAEVAEDTETRVLPDDVAAEADHRIANHLGIIAALIRSQAANLPEEPRLPRAGVRALLQEISVRIDAVGRLHRLVMRQDGKAVVDLATYLREIVAAMGSLAGAERTQFSFDLDPDYITSPKQGIAIGLLVGEAITNALKYAHPAGVLGKIHISARSTPNCRFVIEVADDGVGLPEGFDPGVLAGAGLRLMRALAEQIGGRLDLDQGEIGLQVRLEVPPSAGSPAPANSGGSAHAR